MTQSTEQERAEFEKLWAERPTYMGQGHQKELAWHWWQAARRAQVVPQGVVSPPKEGASVWTVLIGNDPPVWGSCYFDSPERREQISQGLVHTTYESAMAHAQHLLAAAPQPPEAAPVQLPEPGINTASHAGIRVIGYTEQQVRELLTRHGGAHGQ